MNESCASSKVRKEGKVLASLLSAERLIELSENENREQNV